MSTMHKLTIEVSLPDSAGDDLLNFNPVSGTWAISDSDYQHLVAGFAAEEASILTGGRLARVLPEDIKAELFRFDGRSLDGSAGVTSGNLLLSRRP